MGSLNDWLRECGEAKDQRDKAWDALHGMQEYYQSYSAADFPGSDVAAHISRVIDTLKVGENNAQRQ